RRDVRVVRPGEKITFPVTWHGAVLSLGWPFADRDRIDDLSQSALGVAALGLTHLPHRPQLRHQLFLQHAAGLNEKTKSYFGCLREDVARACRSFLCPLFPSDDQLKVRVRSHLWRRD